MEIDEEIEVKGPAVSGRRTSRRQLVTEAIDLAMESRWQDAVNANQRLVNLIPDDVESYNRLGKALTELGRITDARDAYDKALKADPANPIAQRNRDRLQLISETEAAELIKRASQKLEPRFFMEETGKTGVTMLQDVAKSDVLLTLSAGERVGLDGQSGTLEVTTLDGVRIGAVEEQLGVRLVRLMQNGNEYQAGIVGAEGANVRVIIRETLQSPQNAGRISFPPRGAGDVPRPYVREGLLRRGSADDDEEEELDLDVHEDQSDDEDDDSGDFGFHEGSSDER